MSKAGQRRLKTLSSFFRALFLEDHHKFLHQWNQRVVSWCEDARRRGRALRAGEPTSSREWVFEVVVKAERLLTACGPEVERLVGRQTRSIVTNECCKAVAFAFAPEMYQLDNHNSYYLMMTLGTHRLPRPGSHD